MTQIEQLINLFRKRFAIPNLIICIGILFFIGKLVFILFSPEKEVKVKLLEMNPAKEQKFFLKNRNISLSDFEIIPKKNLFRPSRTEWVPPPPPPQPPPPKPPPPLPPKSPPPAPKPVPPPKITITGILGGGKFSKRAILQGIYYTPVDFKEKAIKKKGYKLYEKIGQYRINIIDSDTVALMDPNGKSYEFYLNKYRSKRKKILNERVKLKGKKLLGESVKKWKPIEEPADSTN